jgi:hypothetical protein
MNRQFSKEEVEMANKYVKKRSTSLAIKEMQIKTTLKRHPASVRMASIMNITNVGKDVVKQKPLYTVSRNVN